LYEQKRKEYHQQWKKHVMNNSLESRNRMECLLKKTEELKTKAKKQKNVKPSTLLKHVQKLKSAKINNSKFELELDSTAKSKFLEQNTSKIPEKRNPVKEIKRQKKEQVNLI
jgi:hypothetical protein